jgi:excisionase family DNA binding protein
LFISFISFIFVEINHKFKSMELLDIKKPTKEEQRTAQESYNALASSINQLRSEFPEIEIEETEEKIRIPVSALRFLAKILKEISLGNPISIVPIATEITTQAAAELLGCSRPHIVKLLESGRIPFSKVGKHRRIRYEDLVAYKKEMKAIQKRKIQELMELDEDSGLYDT